MTGVSVIVNTFNEEANLPGCLASVRGADDIVVVDMHSEDRTAEIAQKAGARLFAFERMGFVEPARNFALSKAKNPWALVLDADERVSPGLASWIETNLNETKASAFRIPRRNFYGDRWLTCCGWFPDEQLRLFRRERVRYSDRIHRAPEVDGEIVSMPVHGDAYLEHHVFDTWQSRIAKDNKYSSLAADAMAREGRRISAMGLLTRPAAEFLRAYFMQGGFRCGALGVALAWERAFATSLKYTKLWELQQTPGKPAA